MVGDTLGDLSQDARPVSDFDLSTQAMFINPTALFLSFCLHPSQALWHPCDFGEREQAP